jgi:hypothetical protein
VLLLCLPACATAGSGDGGDDGNPDIDAAPFEDDIDAGSIIGGAIDAGPDAGPLADAAPSCTVQTINLLANGSFDTGPGAPWIESSAGDFPIVVPDTDGTIDDLIDAESPIHVAFLGGYNNAIDSVHQDVQLPVDATDVRLRGFRWIITDDQPQGAFDVGFLEVLSPAGDLLEPLDSWSNQDETADWVPIDVPLVGDYHGLPIRIQMRDDADGSLGTGFFFDTLSLDVTTCL